MKISNKLKHISSLLSISCIFLLLITNQIYSSFHFDGIDILILLYMLITYNIKNLYTVTKIKIGNPFYHTLLISVNLFLIYIFIKAIQLNFIKGFNYSNLFLYNKLLISYLLIMCLYITLFFVKKEKVIYFNIKTSYILIIINSSFNLFSNISLQYVLVITIIILCIILLFKKNINNKEYFKILISLMAFSIITYNCFNIIVILNIIVQKIKCKEKLHEYDKIMNWGG